MRSEGEGGGVRSEGEGWRGGVKSCFLDHYVFVYMNNNSFYAILQGVS